MNNYETNWSAPGLAMALVALLAGVSSCEDESVGPGIGFVNVNGKQFEISNGVATITNRGVELSLEGAKANVTIWVPEVNAGKHSILNTFDSWRLTSGAVATASVRNDAGIYYALDGELALNNESNSLSGTFSFQAKTATGKSSYTIRGEWSAATVTTVPTNTCLLANFKDDFADIDFEYSQNGQLIHATGYDWNGYLFDKYITYKNERPIQILSKEGEFVFYSDSIVYQNDRVSKIFKHQQEYLHVYTFSYQTSGQVSSINMKQYFLGDLIEEWTQQVSYDGNGNQQRENGTANFDSKKNPIVLLQQSLGNFTALSWLIPSDWHMGLWNVNGPNNVISITMDGMEYPYTYEYNNQDFPTKITNTIGSMTLEYINCGQ